MSYDKQLYNFNFFLFIYLIWIIYIAQSIRKIEGCPRIESCSLKNYIKSSIYNFVFGNCWDDKSCEGQMKCVYINI